PVYISVVLVLVALALLDRLERAAKASKLVLLLSSFFSEHPAIKDIESITTEHIFIILIIVIVS
ncbi:MAG: hypothetical protein KBF93_26940, partial [Leptospiraceae bacterium]|nr:hypothetical protein [Leptospiraceae bacterium]